ncbi:formate dehydrogenase accessory sulfurtransferase FdhD [Desulfovibrio inopinatus]|uniref:formate dehydrogenase accessory sulfurtransferase FdhD n=1 Tax=Desulfovibrio inopinatus TaxID=102109 RepID=UPI0004857672|nr:formate dehydrogenase accessory sulfurtransferase FdhD [Desulfovibrio inopinatus]
MNGPGPQQFICRQFKNGAWRSIEDDISPEIRVRIIRLEEPGAELWAYPHDLEALALGHAANEWARPGMRPVIVGREANTFHVELVDVPRKELGVPTMPVFNGAEVLSAMRTFMAYAGLWDGTGCFHRAGAYSPEEGIFVAMAEDIGRHNCLDRLTGMALQHNFDLGTHILFVTARMTASLLAKARQCGFAVVISRSAVTTASVEAAMTNGVTLIGFCRDTENRFTVFNDSLGAISS